MKCDTCKYKKFHPAGSWQSVAEGGDDPYNYEYCEQGNWVDGDEDELKANDPFENCTDYKIKN
jgi:hypothetical protein